MKTITQIIIFILAIGAILVGILTNPPEPTLSQNGIIEPTISPTEFIIPTSIIIEIITPQPESTRIVLVGVESVNVHTQPEIHAPVIGWLFSGQPVPVLVCSSGWALIETPELFGWVNGTCFQTNPCGDNGSCN